jgi:aminomethyltransferase
MVNKTILYDQHLAASAKMVDFAGWEMPLHYGSQVDEHHRVRQSAGMFDVSHMTVVDLAGERVADFLRHLLANDIGRLVDPGKALYSCMLDQQAGVIDDLITYFVDSTHYRLVVNAGTRDKDLAWIREQAGAFGIDVDERSDTAMLAVQGPQARERVLPLLPPDLAAQAADLKPFFAAWSGGWFIARTGYTGEDGFEIILPTVEAPALWRRLLELEVAPIGLGARDSLRLEAGMNLYGSDMEEGTTPLESGLAWTVAWEPGGRDFIGRSALAAQRERGVTRKLVGLVLQGRGVIRNHQAVRCDAGDGEVTSGGFSPTLKRSIALARVPVGCKDLCEVGIRGKWLSATVVKPPFVRNGKIKIEL